MQEQRRFVRLAPPSIGVTYRVVGREAEETVQPAKDISHGGIRFPVSERFPQGATLELELALPTEETPIQAQVEVIWCARFHPHTKDVGVGVHGNGPYEVGCRFTQIDPLDRGKIIRHIHETLKQRKAFTS